MLRFTHLALEPEYRLACRFDSLHVLDGPLLNSTPLGKFCGTELPKPVQSSSNAVSIKLVLDNPYHHAGFRLDYTTKRGRKTNQSPGGVLKLISLGSERVTGSTESRSASCSP